MLARNADQHSGSVALWQHEAGDWRGITWAGYQEGVAETALGLRDLGLGRGDVMLLLCPPSPEALVVDLAALHLGAVPVAVDTGVASPQLSWIVQHAGARIAVTSGAPAGRLAAAAGLREIVTLDPGGSGSHGSVALQTVQELGRRVLERDHSALRRLAARITPRDIATLCYVPAPSGGWRAVTVTHRAALWAAASVALWAGAALDRARTGTLTYLPLSASGGRLFGHYLVLWTSMQTRCCPSVDMVAEAVTAAVPDVLVGVPLVWERLEGRQGLDRCRLPVSIGATLPPALGARLRCGGVGLLNMYGMTETFGPIAAHTPGAPRAGTVGPPVPGVDVGIAQDGEIVVRTGGRIPGYFREPDATARVYGVDGTIRTGDLGRFDDGHHLVLTGRKRNLLVTSGGRNVAPAPLERALAEHPLVERACVLGEGRPFVTAIVAVAPASLAGDGLDKTAASEFDIWLERLNRLLTRGERIRAYRAVAAEWTVATGELSPDGRVVREAVERRYGRLVEDMYAAADWPQSTPVT